MNGDSAVGVSAKSLERNMGIAQLIMFLLEILHGFFRSVGNFTHEQHGVEHDNSSSSLTAEFKSES